MMPPLIHTTLVLLAILSIHRIRKFCFSASNSLPYPPGPNSILQLFQLLVGIRNSRAWYAFSLLKEQYGGLIFLRVLGKNILVINNRDDAIALLDGRSRIYSDRSHMPVVEMTGSDFNSVALGYSNKWRLHRKIYQQFLRSPLTPTFEPVQRAKVHTMLRGLLDAPENFRDHCRTLSGAIIMKVMYDIDIAPKNDFFVEVAEEAEAKLNKIALPSTIFPEMFPLVRYVPNWIPVLGRWKCVVEETRELTHTMMTVPFDNASRNSNPASCVSMRLLENSRSRGRDSSVEHAIRETCATSYAAGAETTVSAMGAFFLAMLHYPEVQRKAQNELDEVLGNRLPEYSDRQSLPYVEAIYREVIRWNPAVPLGIPHCNTEDDVYNGYLIPKGTIIFPNVWGMARDEEIYHNANEFKPERFLREDGCLNDDTFDLAFGFGRRICPGRHMASVTVWMTIASILSVFNIEKAKDREGYEIPVSERFTDTLISHPEPFKCSITPRNDAAIETIRNIAGS